MMQGEDICTAAIREVKEETGVSENTIEHISKLLLYNSYTIFLSFFWLQVDAEFVEVLAFR